MNTLKLICLTLIQLTKTGSRSRTVAQTIRQVRQQAMDAEWEVERLDRIRNPSKYLGK